MAAEPGGTEVGVPDRAIWKGLPRACLKKGPHVDVLQSVTCIEPVLCCTLAERQEQQSIPIKSCDWRLRKGSLQRSHGESANGFEVGRSDWLEGPLTHLIQRSLLLTG